MTDLALPSRHQVADPVDAYEVLRRRVHGEINKRGIDLESEGPVEDLIGEVVDDYQRRATTGLADSAPLADLADMAARLVRSIRHFGPLTEFVSGAVEFEELMIDGDEASYIDNQGRLVSVDEPASEDEYRSIVDKLLAGAGAAVDDRHPMVQAQVLGGTARLGVVIPPIADRLNATLRRYTFRQGSLPGLVSQESLTSASASLLGALMLAPTGVVVSGQPGAGKTTLVNAILKAAPPAQRTIACEDTPEIRLSDLNSNRYRTRPAGPDGSGEVSLRQLVKYALGMRPDLIVVGEVRGSEAYELTRAGNAGCGLLTTLHANSARQALEALISTAVMAGENVNVPHVRSVFCSIIDVVVHLAREPVQVKGAGTGGIKRQVMEISAVLPPLESGELVVTPLFHREEFGAPLRWTENPLPDDLRVRLDRALRPKGLTVHDICSGARSLV